MEISQTNDSNSVSTRDKRQFLLGRCLRRRCNDQEQGKFY